MSDTIEPATARIDQQQLAEELVAAVRAEGVELVGPDGPLAGLTRTVLGTALDAEMTEHLGCEAHDGTAGEPAAREDHRPTPLGTVRAGDAAIRR